MKRKNRQPSTSFYYSITELEPQKFVLPQDVLFPSNPSDLLTLTGCLQRQEFYRTEKKNRAHTILLLQSRALSLGNLVSNPNPFTYQQCNFRGLFTLCASVLSSEKCG